MTFGVALGPRVGSARGHDDPPPARNANRDFGLPVFIAAAATVAVEGCRVEGG